MKGSITRRGKESWRIKYELPRDPDTGKRRIAYVTVRGNRADAEKELRARLTALDKGIHIDPSRITVSDYIDCWLDDDAPESVGRKALERYRGLAKNQIKPHLGPVRLQQLRPRDVKDWLKTLGNTSISPPTVRHAHSLLRSAFKDAAADELIERNVAVMVKLPKMKRKKPTILKKGEIGDALARLEGHPIYPFAALAIGTGARRGEIAALRWSDVDLDAATIRIARSLEQTAAGIRVKPPKTDAGYRTITLPAFVVSALREHRRGQLEQRMALGLGGLPEDAPVFGTIDGDWPNPYTISDRWRDAVKSRKLPKVTLHALRHSHASALIAAGLDIVSISHRLGHGSAAFTLSTYAHLFENKDKAAAAAIDTAIAGK